MDKLIGSFEHQLDEKNRIRIPKKFRNMFPEGEGVYFMKYGGCIAVYPASTIDKRLEPLVDIKSNQPELLRAKRAIMQALVLIEEDGQGRTVLSASMREYAGITKEVVTIGMVDYLEIWAKERLNAKLEQEEQASMEIDEALLTVAF